MNLDDGSIVHFSPVNPDLWKVTFTGEVESWELPVIGFAAVVTYAAKDEGDKDATRLYPVVLDDDGVIASVFEYLTDWDAPRPSWKLKRAG